MMSWAIIVGMCIAVVVFVTIAAVITLYWKGSDE